MAVTGAGEDPLVYLMSDPSCNTFWIDDTNTAHPSCPSNTSTRYSHVRKMAAPSKASMQHIQMDWDRRRCRYLPPVSQRPTPSYRRASFRSLICDDLFSLGCLVCLQQEVVWRLHLPAVKRKTLGFYLDLGLVRASLVIVNTRYLRKGDSTSAASDSVNQ